MHASVYETITQRIIMALERGVVPWHRPWTTCSAPPANLVSRRPYRGINALVTQSAGYASPWWLSFRQVQTHGGRVRKGEHGTPIVFFKPLDGTSGNPIADDNDVASEALASRRHVRAPLLRYTHVFNLVQTEGVDSASVPHVPTSSVPSEINAEALLEAWSQAPRIQWGFNCAAYAPRIDLVKMPPRDHFSTAAKYYGTLFHECAHATGHPSRLGRFTLETTLPSFGSPDYSKEELIAEMAAAFICGELGLDSEIESSAAYVGNWLKALSDDRRLLVQAAADAQRAADCIHGLNHRTQGIDD